MKKCFFLFLFMAVLLAEPMSATAAHQHGEGCYSIQGAHTHSGDSVNGGGCYGTLIYHTHSGDSVNGGGCYGTPVYHVHEGQAGQSTSNGCYTVQSQNTTTRTMNCQYNKEQWDGDYYNAKKICGQCGSVYHYLQTYKDPSTGAISTIFSYDPNANPCYHTVTETTTFFSLGCGKTEQTVEHYELSCGKTTDTIESYSLSCGQSESAGTKVLTCTIPESVDAPAPAPEPTPEPAPKPAPEPAPEKEVQEVVEPVETVPEETVVPETTEETESITISIDASDFDFALDYEFTGDGLYVILKPTNKLALADIPYSWDNKVTWNTNTECLFTEPGEYHISVKNVDGEIKTKILTVDFELQTVTIENEETALANADIPETKSSGIKIPFKAILIVVLVLAAAGGIGFLSFTLLAGAGISAKVVDDGTDAELGTVKLKKKGDSFEAVLSDKILLNQETTLTLIPSANILKKYIGYSLTVKSSSGVVETEISSKIDVEF